MKKKYRLLLLSMPIVLATSVVLPVVLHGGINNTNDNNTVSLAKSDNNIANVAKNDNTLNNIDNKQYVELYNSSNFAISSTYWKQISRFDAAAFSSLWVSGMIPYQITIAQLQAFAQNNTSSLLENAPSNPTYSIASDTLIVDNKAGEITFDLSLNFYLFNGTIINQPFPIKKRITLFNFNQVTASALDLISTNPIANFYPSTFDSRLKELENNQTALFNFMNNYFNIGTFPPTTKISFNNFANNATGQLNVKMHVDRYYANDSYFTYIENPFAYSLNLLFQNQGLTTFKTYTIDISNNPTLNAYSMEQFLDELAKPGNNTNNPVKNQMVTEIYNIIDNKNVAITTNQPNLISFDQNKNNYDIQSNLGILTLSATLNDLIVNNQEIVKEKQFNKTTPEKIYVIGFDAIIDTIIQEDLNAPIVTLAELTKNLNVSGSYYSTANAAMRKFIQVVTPQNTSPNLALQFLSCIQPDPNVLKAVATFNFSNAYVNGQLSNITKTFSFNILPSIYNTELAQSVVIYSENGNFIPSDIYNDPIPGLEAVYKKLLIENALLNLPSTGINDDNIRFNWVNYDNSKGEITIEVFLNKYLENSNIIESTVFKRFGDIIIQGYNVTSNTTVTINPNYPKNILPNKLQEYIDNYMIDKNKNLTETMKLFFKFANIPTLPEPFEVTRYSISNINSDLGTATINIVCDNVFGGNNSRLMKGITFSSNFLLLEPVEPTRIKSPISLTGFSNILASEFANEFNTSSATDPRFVALKNTILNQSYIINQPNIVDITNITILNVGDIDDIKKEFNISVTLNAYFDENGDLQNKPITFPNANFPEPILVRGDFRNVIDTKFIANSYLVENNRNELASSFLQDDIKEYIINNWKRLNMIGGDIPKIFNIDNDLVIDLQSITYDDPKGTISLKVSLKSYYLNQVLHNNTTPYEPFTEIILTGFYSNVPTIFPDTVSATVNQGLPSEIWDNNPPAIAKSWPDYIINDVLGGSIDKITITNETNMVKSVNDLKGEIDFEYTTNGYWSAAANPGDSAIWDDTPQTKKLKLTGLRTQAPTSFTKSNITPNNANAFLASDWKMNNFENINQQKQFLLNQNLLNASASGFEYLFKTSPTDIVVNNINGTITLTVYVSRYYDDVNAILSTYDLTNNNASYFRDNIHTLPTDQMPPSPNPLQETITISGFRSIISTGFKNDTTIKYTGAGNLTTNNATEIHAILSNVSDTNHDNYTGFIEDFLWDEIVIGTKSGPENNDAIRINFSIVSADPNNITGTLNIKMSLSHYWNTAGQWVNGNSAPLIKDIVLTGFLQMIPTTFNPDNKLTVTGNITNSTASDVAASLSNNNNDINKQVIQSLIFNADVMGTKNPYLFSSDIINNSFVVSKIEDEKGEITLTYSLNKYVNSQGEVVNATLSRPISLVISGFKIVSITKVLPNINLNQWLKDENGTQFEVSNITANDYISSANFNEEIRNLLTINRNLYFGDIPPNWNSKEDFLEITDAKLNPNDTTTILLTFRMQDVYIKDNANNTIVEGIATFSTILSGFKQPVFGPTTFQNGFARDLADIPAVAFRTYIYAAPINGLRQNFINQLTNNSPTAIDNLRQFIFHQWVNLNSNIGDGTISPITYQDMRFEVTAQSIGSSLTIEIWLAKYYNNVGNGEFVDNAFESTATQKRLAQQNNVFRKVDIRGFVEPTSTRGPTTVTRINQFDISEFTDPNTGNTDDSLVNLLPSAAIDAQYDRGLRLWILQKIYGGNKEGFETDFENVDITSSNPDDRNGELRVTVQLKKYWGQPTGNPPSSPIAYNGLVHTFTIKFKKQLLPTTINTPNNLTLNVPNNDPKYTNILNDIQSKTPQAFYADYSTGNKWQDFIDYVTDWLVLNKNSAFSNLPENLNQDNQLLKNAIKIDYIRNSNVDASIYLNISLSRYVNSEGQIIDNGNYRVSVQFTGFNRNNQPTYPLDARVDISQNPTSINGVEHFYIPELAALDASKATFDKEMSFPRFLSLITPIIQKYCITGRTDGLLESNNINLTSYQQVQFISTFGSLIIRFNFNQIYNSEGQPISGINNPVTLTLFGFTRKPPTLQSTESIIPFVLGGIGAAVLIIFIIIAFIIYYKKRKDVEYQQ